MSVKVSAKLSGDERRAAIIKAVKRVFAEKGFDGTTTRELADAAGVSEALLFKHFPNKEALFWAVQLSCCDGQDLVRLERLVIGIALGRAVIGSALPRSPGVGP